MGHSTVKEEIATLTDYLKLPNVHLGIDPEFSMKGGEVPVPKLEPCRQPISMML